MAGSVQRFALLVNAVGLTVGVWGCASGRQGPLVTQRVQDPPQLSPYARPLATPGTAIPRYDVKRPTPADPAQAVPSQPHNPPTTVSPRRPEAIDEQRSPPPADPSPRGPSLGELSAPPPARLEHSKPNDENSSPIIRGDPVEWNINAPADAKVGDAVPFSIVLRNAQHQAIDDVTVLCTLPEGFVLPGMPQRAFRQRLGTLSAGEERTLELSLRGEQAGRQCVEFRVSAEGFDEISQSVCVTCRDESVRLDVSGPTERSTGSRAEFVVTMVNLTGRELPDVHVLLEHDGVLEPREASAGVRKAPGRLEWDLGLVRIDERVQIQVEFACGSVTEQTCITVRVAGRDLDPREVKSCLRVIPLREIEIDVRDDQDPVAIGAKIQYHVRVTNHGLESVTGLQLEFAPDGLQPVGVAVEGEDVLSKADFDPVSGVLRVPLPGPIPAEGAQQIILQTTASHSGQGRLRATVTQRHGAIEVTTVESTVVNALPGSIASGDP
ncbi:MAG: hypothetical protein AB7U20_02630 [Planctomycetaceae bacterium]